MPVRVTDRSGNAAVARIVSGIITAADNGARVINISFGDLAGNALIQEAARYAMGKGAVVVAAGNNGVNAGLMPTNTLLVVGSSNECDKRIAWSDYGPHLSLVAPGQGVWTTTDDQGYKAVYGTSFSAPMVAGVVSMMMAVNPSATPEQIMAWVRASADDIGAPGPDLETGSGRLNAERAVRMALNPGAYAPAGTLAAGSSGSALGGSAAAGTCTAGG